MKDAIGGNLDRIQIIKGRIDKAGNAVRFNIKMPPEVPMKHQERAWTSPVWYAPQAS